MNSVEVNGVWKKFKLRTGRTDSFGKLLRFSTKNKTQQEQDFWALKDISFSVKRGESVGIVGTNGSGKSTLLKLLTKIMKPTKGEVVINGKVSALIELGAGFHPDFSGRDNIYVNGMMLGMTKKEIQDKFDEIVDFAEIESFIDVPLKYYSSGMQARLGFSVATSIEPEILIVDEVLTVGDAEFQKKCRTRIQGMVDTGTSLLLVSHGAGDIEAICQNALWINKGNMMMYGESSHVVSEYLGRDKSS